MRREPPFAELAALIHDRFPLLESISYITFSATTCSWRLDVHGTFRKRRDAVRCYAKIKRVTDTPFIRQCLGLCQKYLVARVQRSRELTFMLIDPVRNRIECRSKPAWQGPRDDRHPHQLWLSVERADEMGNCRSFLAACPELPEEILATVLQLHDSAQYHFINCLLNESEQTPKRWRQALLAALRHQAELPLWA